MLSPRPAKRCTTDSTSRRFPEISSSRAPSSPARAFFSSARVCAAVSRGSSAVFTPQISTFPCIDTPPFPFSGAVIISRAGKFDTDGAARKMLDTRHALRGK